MTKHTPGPWAFDDDRVITSPHTHNDLDDDVCEVYGGNDDIAEVRRANARLIAAAPELLEALKELMVAADRVSAEPVTWLGKARAAIAKAEGTTE